MKKISRRNFLLASGVVTVVLLWQPAAAVLPAALLLPLPLLHPLQLLLLRLLPRARC